MDYTLIPKICHLHNATSTTEFSSLETKYYSEYLANEMEQMEPREKEQTKKKSKHRPSRTLTSSIKLPRFYSAPKCYRCAKPTNKFSWFYWSLCPECGNDSYRLRHLTTDLTGQRAIVTGGRLKLGFQIALKLLRFGAEVLITSRQWNNAIEAYKREPDYDIWKNRLYVAKLNFDLLRIDELLPQFGSIIDEIWGVNASIDIIVHNAAQTIFNVAEKLPECMSNLSTSSFLSSSSSSSLSSSSSSSSSSPSSSSPEEFFSGEYLSTSKRSRSEANIDDFPDNEPLIKKPKSMESNCESRYPPSYWSTNPYPPVDKYHRLMDERSSNTWSTEFGNVNYTEAKQVLLANAWAPFVLNEFLLPRLMASTNQPYIIHVHAKEGNFSAHKTLNHTHTNMAKAALSMMTRCIGGHRSNYDENREYQRRYIHGLNWAIRYSPDLKRSAKMEKIQKEVKHTRHYKSKKTLSQPIVTDIPKIEKKKLQKENKISSKIRVHGVDPGWFSIDEYSLATRQEKHLLFPPIDDIDAASAVVYPIVMSAPSFPGTWKHYIPQVDF